MIEFITAVESSIYLNIFIDNNNSKSPITHTIDLFNYSSIPPNMDDIFQKAVTKRA